METDRQAYRETGRQADGQKDRDRQACKEVGRQTETGLRTIIKQIIALRGQLL